MSNKQKMREALKRLADACDVVVVTYFDTDTMSDEVPIMQAATRDARAALAEQPAQGVLDGMADRAWQRFEAALAQPEPVAWGMPNTAITGKNMALMMVRLDIPSDDQYGGSMWVPLYTAPPAPAVLNSVEIDGIKTLVPDGWKLVPARSTQAWVETLTDRGLKIGSVAGVIESVLAAAPEVKP